MKDQTLALKNDMGFLDALDEEVTNAADLLCCEDEALRDALVLVQKVRRATKEVRGGVAKDQAQALYDEAVVFVLTPTLLRTIEDAFNNLENRQCELLTARIHKVLKRNKLLP